MKFSRTAPPLPPGGSHFKDAFVATRTSRAISPAHGVHVDSALIVLVVERLVPAVDSPSCAAFPVVAVADVLPDYIFGGGVA